LLPAVGCARSILMMAHYLSFFLSFFFFFLYVRVLVHRPHILMDINSFAMALPLDNSKY
jgi:hypothetical protein